MKLLPVVAMTCFINTSFAYAKDQSSSTTVSKLAKSSMSPLLPEEPLATKCEEIVGRLVKFQSFNRNVLQNMIDSARDAAFIFQDWYDTYSQDYGRTVYVPYGNYENIRQSAVTQRQNVQVFVNDASKVNDRLMAIIADLAACKISTP
jgi:hypothetical protein